MAEVVTPKGKLDLSAVTDLYGELVGLKGKDVVVDLSQVTQLGALCLQTLVSAAKSAEASENSFEITGASEQVAAHILSMGQPLPALNEVAP